MPVDFAVHGVFKQDSPHDAFAIKTRTGYDAGAHFVYQLIHFVIVSKGICTDTIIGQGLWGATSTLIQSCDKSGLRFDFLNLLVKVGHGYSF